MARALLPLQWAGVKAFDLYTLARAGMLRPERPDRAARIILAIYRWGPLAAAAYGAALLHPHETALVDERGELTFEQLHRRSNALARGLAREGLDTRDVVAILCRNHRGFLDATLACSKLGLRALFLNTDFAGPQVADVLERERVTAVIFDEEFAELVDPAARERKRYVAWVEQATQDATLDGLIAASDDADLRPPREPGSVVMLTSGTTGTPKGAPRRQPRSFGAGAALLSKIPLRAGEPMLVGAPMFHAFGFTFSMLAIGLGSKLVIRRRFDPAWTLEAIEAHRCTGLFVVPVMLQRVLERTEELRSRDLSSLRVVVCGGSALSPELARRAMETLGDVLYNLYGSTEVAWASIATPEDVRAAPGTVGRPPRATVVRLYDQHGRPVRGGESGRIFVGNEMQFEGYTGGGSKEVIDGLMATGDVGHFDAAGRLFVDGRDDEMIVSGGENVFPKEVEDLLVRHEAIADAAVIGVDDPDFGQRLRAFVVLAPGASLAEEEVKEYVRRNLARFKAPREVVFLEELPRNPTGKVLKRELAARA